MPHPGINTPYYDLSPGGIKCRTCGIDTLIQDGDEISSNDHLPHGDLHFPGAELISFEEYLAARPRLKEEFVERVNPATDKAIEDLSNRAMLAVAEEVNSIYAIGDEEERQQALKDMQIPAVYAFMRRLMPDWMFAQRYPELVRQ